MKKSSQDILVQLLRDCAKHIQTLSQEEFEDLLTGTVKIELKTVRRSARKGRRGNVKIPEGQLSELRNALENIKTREEGEILLNQICKSRDDLLQMAKFLDLPVQKSDDLHRLKDKIIEATIGYRVRSAAIQKTTSDI